MGAVDKSASVDASEPVLDGLLWPAPVADSDIMWLDEPEPTVPSTATITPSPAATAPAPAGANPSSETSARPSVAASPEGHRPFVPLSQLLSADVAYEWHEAVALVQQLADQLIPDKTRLPVGSIPQIEAIALGSSGRLRAQLDPTRSELLVAGLGQLLHRLLQDKPGPANLRLMAWQAASDMAAPVSIPELTRQLAGWERPGRLEKLAKLYERALAAAPVQAAAPMPVPAPVQVKVQAPKPPQEREPPKPSTSRIRSPQMAAAAGLIAAACVTAAVAVRAIVHTSSGSPLTAEAPSAADTRADIQLPASKIGERARQAASAAARQPRRTASRSGERPDPNMVTTGQNFSAVATGENFEGAPRSPGAPLMTALPLISEPLMYTSDDRSVIEPVLIKPRLPLRTGPGVSEDKLGVLELVVDTRGLVESVHLRSPSNRYRERWWVFAAKTWQFRPALKDGKPVRFLKRVALTDLNLAEPQ